MGEAGEVRLGQGVVRYREVGEGETVVFISEGQPEKLSRLI